MVFRVIFGIFKPGLFLFVTRRLFWILSRTLIAMLLLQDIGFFPENIFGDLPGICLRIEI